MKTAIIVGCKGQDGTLLSEYLTKLHYQIVGLDKNYVTANFTHNLSVIDIEQKQQVEKLVQQTKPDEIYYFATYHHSSEDVVTDDYSLVERSYAMNVLGALNFMEGIKSHAPQCKLFYTSSSLIFGSTDTEIQNEHTLPCPDTVYGITKLMAQQLCTYYRNNHQTFASVGIMYNHESHLRLDNFLSKKIIKTALEIKQNKASGLTVGDLEANVDWGYAPDYVEAMHQILQLDMADEFIIATGVKHTVKDFIKKTFETVGLDYTLYVSENKDILSRKKKKLVGDSSKLRKATGWVPKTSFDAMIEAIIEKMQ